jgi:hypothetical protein
MPEAAPVTPAEIRAYANLPSEVPEALLEKHIGIATRDLTRATGVAAAPDGKAEIWAEALTVRALASVFPWLNTFALDGAAKVGRLEGSVEYRFLDAEEVEARVDELNGRFDELVAELAPVETSETPSDQVSTGVATLIAV